MPASTVAIDFARCNSLRHVPSSGAGKKLCVVTAILQERP
jgi:hypothetical protein